MVACDVKAMLWTFVIATRVVDDECWISTFLTWGACTPEWQGGIWVSDQTKVFGTNKVQRIRGCNTTKSRNSFSCILSLSLSFSLHFFLFNFNLKMLPKGRYHLFISFNFFSLILFRNSSISILYFRRLPRGWVVDAFATCSLGVLYNIIMHCK